MSSHTEPQHYIAFRETTDFDDLISAIIEAEPNSGEIQTGLQTLYQVRASAKGAADNCNKAFVSQMRMANSPFFFSSKNRGAANILRTEFNFVGFVTDQALAEQIVTNLQNPQVKCSFTHAVIQAAPTAGTPVTETQLSTPMP